MNSFTISRVRTHQVTVPGDVWTYVSIETKEGLVGWGEMSDGGHTSVMAQTVDEMAPLLLGRDPSRLIELREALQPWKFPNTYQDRLHVSVLSAIDQALWDLYAQQCGLPLYVLLGASGRSEIKLYANLNRGLRASPQLQTPEALEERGKRAMAEGFAFVKCTPFYEQLPHMPEYAAASGLQRIRQLLQSVPMERVAIDFHQRFERWSLERLLPELLAEGMPYWLEDPVSQKDTSIWSLLRDKFPAVRWAGGEATVNAHEAWRLMEDRRIDVFMPDVKHAGGVSGLKTLMALAEARDVAVSLHNPAGPVSTAFSAHLSAACRKALPLEFPFGVTPLRQESVVPAEPVNHGTYTLSQEAGIGVKPNPDFMKEYGKVWGSGAWSNE